jgi:predicted dehydrogenase
MAHPMLWEQSVHHLDLLRFVYGREPVSVYCRTANPAWSMYGSDTNVFALVTLEGGLVVSYQGSWQSSWSVPNFEWRTDAAYGVALQREQFGALAYARREDAQLTPVPLPPHETWISDTEGVLQAFASTLLDGAPLECSARDHLRSLALVEACVRSSALGEAVMLAKEEAFMS